MPLVPAKNILLKAYREGYAIGAFNFVNMEMLQAILQTANNLRAPVIIQASEGAISYAGLSTIVSMARTLAGEVDIPVALHLDHGHKLETIRACIQAGFTSVMIDASHLPYAENAALTRQVVEIARQSGVSVEAELGRLMGVEDTVSVAERDAVLVDPEEAGRFVRETDIDSLAPAVGTSHGAFKYKGAARLDLERLKKVKEKTGIPLVLHGASSIPADLLQEAIGSGIPIGEAKGVPLEEVQKAIKVGVAKVNIDTDLRLGFVSAMRRILAEKPETFDLRKILGPAREKVAQIIADRIQALGCADRV
ncbi:MAG: class II fructose-1,6-bisphosphate aldolase [Thermodesulfobacteriota bacterium]|nr:class II fructose-1,6-bisphosphate aldolase [Thermodesulfobacteriota bacterium]